MKHFLIILLFLTNAFATVSGHNTRFTKAQVEKDVNNQNMAKYKDNFETLNVKSLADKNILNSSLSVDVNSTKTYIEDTAEFSDANDFAMKIDCSQKVNLQKWSATLYSVDTTSGIVSCMIAPIADLNNPIGLFKIYYPNSKKLFVKNLELAKAIQEVAINQAKEKFDGIYTTIQQKSDELIAAHDNGNIHLTVPSLFLNTILTNTDIIDVEATRDLGKLSFQNNVTPSPVAEKIALNDAETFSNVYAG